MMNFVIEYWLAIAPSFLTGLYLLSMVKRLRDEKRAGQPAPATIEIERRQQTLNAAGWTYVAAAIAAIGPLLYYVSLLTGGSRRD